MQNAGLDEAQAGIKILGRNINNLGYADDTTLMAESKGESEKADLKQNIQKTKITASPKFMLIALVIPSSHLIVRHPLLLQPSVFPSIRDFCSELSFLIR